MLRVVFYGTVVFAILPWVFSSLLIGPIRQPADPPPLGFEETWREADGLRFRGWLRAGRPERPAVVVAHDLGDSIESFVGVARRLNERGHTVLLAELRGHGRSDGTQTTLGGMERDDVRSGLEQLVTRGLAARGFVVFGVSMGAVAVLRAAADRSDVHAVVVEAPYDGYRQTVAHHARLFYGLPGWVPLIPLSIAVAEWRAGFDPDEVDAVAAARQVHAPSPSSTPPTRGCRSPWCGGSSTRIPAPSRPRPAPPR